MAKEKLNPTLNSLSPKVRGEISALLNALLADLSDLYSQSKQAHWNVRGRRFYPLHKLFDDVAESVEEHLDDLAERLVQLGGYACGTVRMAAGASRLKEWPTEVADPDGFVRTLAERFATGGNSVRSAIELAAKLGDSDTSDLLTDVSRDLDKSLWQLEASQ